MSGKRKKLFLPKIDKEVILQLPHPSPPSHPQGQIHPSLVQSWLLLSKSKLRSFRKLIKFSRGILKLFVLE